MVNVSDANFGSQQLIMLLILKLANRDNQENTSACVGKVFEKRVKYTKMVYTYS